VIFSEFLIALTVTFVLTIMIFVLNIHELLFLISFFCQ